MQPPHLSSPIVDGTDFKFSCLVPYPPSTTDAIFEVTWLSGGVQLPVATTLSGTQREAILHGDDLEGHLNSNLECRVVSKFADNRSNMTSPPMTSNKYWVGVKASGI